MSATIYLLNMFLLLSQLFLHGVLMSTLLEYSL